MKQHLYPIIVTATLLSALFFKEKGASNNQYPLAKEFELMNTQEAKTTGITKLSLHEQHQLISWWNNRKAFLNNRILQQARIIEILDEGKYVILEDDTKLYFSKDERQKTSLWQVDETIGIGIRGRRGTLTVYHIPTGRRLKARRDQSPQTE